MARLSTYAIDGTPVSSDKLIGTDDSGVATKNYPLGTVAAWLKESGATAILGQNNFIFQTEVDPQVGRLPGTFSLPVVGGDGTPFSDITTLKFSITSSAGQYVVDYIASTVGSKVILGQLDDLNAFGVYALESFTQDPETPTFYNAVLSLASGNGSLIGAKSYGFATYSSSATSGGTWGGITGTITNQTDLVDYVTAPRASYAIQTPNGTSLIIVAGNDGTLAAIPPTSTAPSITTLPTISGTLNVGRTLTATPGTVTGEPAPTQVLQWQRSDNGTTGWSNIAGATGTTYLLGSLDEDKYIRVQQTEENVLGTATANSASTGQIQPAAFVGLLDTYSGAAAAYSLRKLSFTYSGAAIVVRRSSDNTTQAIGFVNNELDTTSLESFCSGTDGFVTTWYDQSGNGNDAVNATAAEQPQIVSSGTAYSVNSKPAISGNGSKQLGISTELNISTDFFIATTLQYDAHTMVLGSNIDTANFLYSSSLTQYRARIDNLNVFFNATALALNTQYNSNVFRVGNDVDHSRNGTLNGVISGAVGRVFKINALMNGYTATSYAMSGYAQEIIIWDSNQSTNRTGIETNINDFYSIY